MKRKKDKGNNPFAGYQKKRSEETAKLTKGAIARIKEVKGKVSYATVAKLAGRSTQAIRNNKEAALLVEQAMAKQRGSVVPMLDHMTAMPTNLDDCHSILRIQRVDIKDLKQKISAYQALIKNYDLSSEGLHPAENETNEAYLAAVKIIMAILKDNIYRFTGNGIESSLGTLIAPNRLCTAAGLMPTQEEF